MSRYGVEVIHPGTGVTSIDEETVNYMVAYKGTFTTGGRPANTTPEPFYDTSVSYYALSKSCYAPVLALRCTSAVVAVSPTLLAGIPSLTAPGTFTWEIFCDNAAAQSVDYWIFDLARNGLIYDAGDPQFEVRDAAGELCFSNLMRPLMDAQVLLGVNVDGAGTDHLSPRSTTGTWSGTSGRIYAHIPLRSKVGMEVTSNRYSWDALVGAQHSGAGLTYGRVRGQGRDFTPGLVDKGVYNSQQSFVLADVTDL